MQRAGAGVFFAALILSVSAGVAHADPGFVLAESQVRAGDAVHFSIAGADDYVKYEIEIAGREVVEAEADVDDGAVVSGQFTMPDLGGSARSVTVDAEIRDDDGRTTIQRKLQYLGAALPVIAKPAPPPPAPAPVVPKQAAAAPAPAHAPAATHKTDTAPKPAVKQRSKRAQRRHRRARRTAQRHGETKSNGKRAKRRSDAKSKRSNRRGPRTAPLFDGVPEPDTGGYSAGGYEESAKPKTKPPAAVLTNPVSSRSDGAAAAAILIPAVLGCAAALLATATLLRRRRTR